MTVPIGPGAVLNELVLPEGTPEVSFDFNPKGTAYSYVAGSTTFMPTNAWHVAVNTSITFTATAVFHAGENAVDYGWEFGDGVQGFGESVAHSYKLVNPVQVVLAVTDSQGRVHRCRRQLYPI